MKTREEKIVKIIAVISDWGNTTPQELELDCSPCINSIGNGKNNVSQLIEEFNSTDVLAVTYHDEIELGQENIAYDDLSDEIIDEIFEIIETYDVSMQKTMDRCKNENF